MSFDEITTLDEAACILGDGGDSGRDLEINTNSELVDALVELGNTDKVFEGHDEHLGLVAELSPEFLKADVSGDSEEFKADTELVLEQFNAIYRLARRELTDELQESINEDKASRGEDIDD
ncbi:MAG: hypothetical protein RPR91_10670 [Colwellia sp.]